MLFFWEGAKMNKFSTIFVPKVYTYTKMPIYQGVLNQVIKDDHSNTSHSTAPLCSIVVQHSIHVLFE